MAITIKDIARLSGFGISTVSRVINNKGYVSDEAKTIIKTVIEDLNYVPNKSAQNLKSTSSKTIALIVKGITNPFFNRMTRVIEHQISLRGYSLSVVNADFRTDEMRLAIHESSDKNICGVIVMGGSFSYTEEQIQQLGIPCVLLTISASEAVPKEIYSSVIIDDYSESMRTVEALISMGHRKIALIDQLQNTIVKTPNLLRFEGYQQALKNNHIPFDDNLVILDYSLESSGLEVGFRAMKQLLSKNPDLTAVFCLADIIAIGAAKAILSVELSIPEISIIGFDGIELTEYYHPAIDSISQPSDMMAKASIEALFSMMSGGIGQHLIYPCNVLHRGSCRKIETV